VLHNQIEVSFKNTAGNYGNNIWEVHAAVVESISAKTDQVDATGILPRAYGHDRSFADDAVAESSTARNHTYTHFIQHTPYGDLVLVTEV